MNRLRRAGGASAVSKETDIMRMATMVFMFFLLAPLPALAQYDKSPDTKQPPPKQEINPNGPRASVILAPAGARNVVDLPRDKMIEVLSEIDKGDPKEASHELKTVIEAMQAAADTSLGEAIRGNVLRSVVELSSRAERLHAGGKVSSEEMTPMFSRALQALAEHHAALAHAHFQNGDNILAGDDLRAAVLNANQSLVWGNVKTTTDDTSRLDISGKTAKTLIDQKTVDKIGTEKLIADLQGWVHDLKTRLPKAGA